MSAPALAPEPSQRSGNAPVWTAFIAVVLAVVGWAFTQGSRLSAVEASTAALREQSQAAREQLEQRLVRAERDASEARAALQSIDQRLARIEGKLERGR